MNSTTFVMLMISVLCAIVTARQIQEVSKETKLGTSTHQTTIKGVGAELSAAGETYSYTSGYSLVDASHGPKGPRADTSENGYSFTNGRIIAKGPKSKVSSNSGSSSIGGSIVAANRTAAAASAGGPPGGSTGSSSTVEGSTDGKKKDGKGNKN